MILYLDTSAVAKLMVAEAESPAVVNYLNSSPGSLVSSALLETELRRFAQRKQLDQARVTDVLTRINLHAVSAALLRAAGLLPGADLRALDAIHVATALRVEADTVLSYDVRLGQAARAVGLDVRSPGV